MKLILAIMSNDDSPTVSSKLNKAGYQVTKLATTGGFLRAGNTTLICGCDDDKVDTAIDIIEKYSSKRTEIVPNTAGYDMSKYRLAAPLFSCWMSNSSIRYKTVRESLLKSLVFL